MEWLIVSLAVAVALVLGMLFNKPDPFRTAATSLGLDHSRSVPELLPRLRGTINGVAVRVDVPEQDNPAIRYRVFYPDLGMALRLERETSISRTLGTLGSGDQQLGHKAFDDTFRVNTSRPDALQKMMTPELRSKLVGLVEKYPPIVVADGEIALIADTAEPTAATIAETVNDLVTVAVLLGANRPPPLQKPAIRPPTRAESRPATTSDQPATPRSKGPSRTEPKPPEQPPPPEIKPDPEPVPTTGLPDGFFDEVFGESRLSFESGDRFEQEIKGRTVRLSGTARQSSRYENRRELSPSSGTKAVITVAQIDSDLYGKQDVDAVVYLADTVELNRGDAVSFTGIIDSVDAFMRNLVVSDASLTAR